MTEIEKLAARALWTPERIVDVIRRRGFFHTGPRYRDDQARRVAARMVKKGILTQRQTGFREHEYRLAEVAARAAAIVEQETPNE